jgi:hypothetical protein
MDVTVDCLSNFISPNKYKYDWLCIHYTFILWQNIGVSVDASTGAKVGITPIIFMFTMDVLNCVLLPHTCLSQG